MSQLYLIRHGKTQSNLEKRYLGVTDESLCREGMQELRQQMEEGFYPKLRPGDILAVSPMKRCIETAGLLYPDCVPIVIPSFREIDFGCFEGKNYRELDGDARYQQWIDSGGRLPFPEGESREAFVQRNVEGMRELLTLCQRDGRSFDGAAQTFRVILVVHGGTIMSLLSEMNGMSCDYYDFMCANGEGYVCDWNGEIRGGVSGIRPMGSQ